MRRPEPRPDLESLQPYRSSETAGGRVLLHANENPYPPPPDVVDEIFDAARLAPLNRYPDPRAGRELAEEIASYAGVDTEWVWVGDGANEVLLQCCLSFGGPGRVAMLLEPTYRMHHRQARMAGMDVVEVPRAGDFTVDMEETLGKIDVVRPHVLFLCTPNNPTGTVTEEADVMRLVEAAPGLVVVDEAYFEFCGQTIVPSLGGLPNVVVVRTLSKAFRLASVRLGYGIADPAIIEQLRRVRMPYAQSAFTQIAATIAMRRRERLLDVVPKLVAERDRVGAALGEIEGIEVYPSGANFVLFRHPRSAALLEALGGRGIVIRDFTHLPGCEGCLRVTAGTPDQNEEFLDAVRVAS